MLQGDCRDVLPTLAPGNVQCIVTSPPYYALRDYGTATWDGGDLECDHTPSREPRSARASNGLTGGKATIAAAEPAYRAICGKCGALRRDNQIGLEAQPDCLAWARQEPPCGACYVCALRHVFALLWPVLRADGVAWLNLGDSYSAGKSGRDDEGPVDIARRAAQYGTGFPKAATKGANGQARRRSDIPDKNLLGIPWRVALALQADGWILRSDVVWSKPNCMPESVKDRPTRAHEYVFLLAKRGRYFFDSEAIAEAATLTGGGTVATPDKAALAGITSNGMGATSLRSKDITTRNARTVWTIPTRPYAGAHFAVFPEDLAERCIRAGSRPGDAVLDPFGGSGTVARVAERLNRDAVLIELNPAYVELQEARTNGVQKELAL